MKQEKVSFRQLMALLWAGLLGPAAEWLPSMVTERAGPAGWLVPLLALPVLLLLAARMAVLYVRTGQKLPSRGEERVFWALLIYFLAWGVLRNLMA